MAKDDYNHRQLGRGKSRVTITHPRTGQKIPLKVHDYKHGGFTQGMERYNNARSGQRLGSALTASRSDTAQRHGSAIGAAAGASLPVHQRSSAHRHADGWWKRTGVRGDATYRESDRLHIRRRTKRERRNQRIGQAAAVGLGGAGVGGAIASGGRHRPGGRRVALGVGAGAALGGAVGAAFSPAHHQLEYRPDRKKRVKKADLWAANLEVPIVPNYRGRRANYRTGTATVGKRQTGVVEGVATPKRVQPGRKAARKVSGSTPTTVRINPATMLPENPQMVGKGLAARPMPRGKAGPVVAGGIATGTVAGLAARAHNRRLIRRENTLQDLDEGQLRSMYSKRDRRYNPEANRQRRLGYAAAGTGIAGGAAVFSGGRAIRNSSKVIDASAPTLRNKAAQPGTARPAKATLELLAERGKHGIQLVDARSAGKLGVGAGLLAASGGLAHYGRSRSNREWR